MQHTSQIQEIPLSDLSALRVGNTENKEAGTGVTALLFPQGARVGCDISGGGPASRETPLASPVTADSPVHAILLSGGSAFGLAAADGAMRFLEAQGIGFATGYATIPLVCQSCIYDLGYRRSDIRPDAAMGYEACRTALASPLQHAVSGSIGAGCGATVGKFYGMERSMKSGLGIYAASVGNLQMAAIVAVNALGDIHDPVTGQTLAGLRTEDLQGFSSTEDAFCHFCAPRNLYTGNTTIGAIVTNGLFSKAELTKIASMTRNAYGHCIHPVGTMADGDTIYAASCGDVSADINLAGVLASRLMEQAIVRAVTADPCRTPDLQAQ